MQHHRLINPPFSKGEAQHYLQNRHIIPPFEKGGRGGILTVCLILQFSYRTTLEANGFFTQNK
jgi:hypothetical protein